MLVVDCDLVMKLSCVVDFASMYELWYFRWIDQVLHVV